MELVAILAAFEGACDGKQGSDEVQVPAELLLAAQHELKGKAQMAKDLEMARDEASMKPSVARKLNEKIRALETELEQLRSNKRVKELERKIQILEHDLKQSYTTKNFTLKSGLLELEKQYRPHMNVDPAMAAFWDDIVVLLDEKKERDFHTPFQAKGPRTTAPSAGPAADSSSSSLRTPRASLGGSSTAPTPAAAGTDQASAAAGSNAVSGQEHPSTSKPANASELQQSSSTAVQQQVESFNTIISEEAAGAATLLADAGSSKQESGEVVVRHGAGFRVVRPAGVVDPQADAAAADGSTRVAVASGPAEPAEQQQRQQQQQEQKLALLQQDFASKLKAVTFHAMPASLQMPSGDAAGAAVQQLPADSALQQQSEAVSSSFQSVQAQFSSMDAAVLPLPPPLAGAGDKQQQHAGEVDTASLWQHQLQHLLDAAAQLKQQLTAGTRSADTLQQQQTAAEGLLESVTRMQAVLQGASSSDPAGKQSLAAAVNALSGLQQELQELLRCVQRMAAEAGGQQLLVSVFGGFLTQLDKQGVLTPEAAGGSAAQQPEEQPAMLSLLQSFLQANPQIPQMLAVQLAPAVPPVQQPEQEPLPTVEVSSTGVQAVADAEHQAVQAVADAEHREVQAVADAEHREVQCQAAEAQHMATQSEPAEAQHMATQSEPAEAQHMSTQSEPLPSDHVGIQTEAVAGPSDHVETQTEAAAVPAEHVETQTEAAAGPADHAETQTEPGQADHTGTQTEPSVAPVSHASTQAAAEAVSAGVQTIPPSPVAAAVQAELRPEVSEVGSQADFPAAAAAAQAQTQVTPAAAGDDLSSESSLFASRQQHGSGIIYSASGSELSVEKAAVGQQLDILHRIERSRAGDVLADDEGVPGAAAVLEVKPEDLQDLPAVAKELGQLRAGNLELAASLQVERSLVQHLNSSLKAAVDKADDAEAEAVQVKQLLDKTIASLTQLQEEHADVTHLLIEVKVDNAERKGELLKLVRDLRRAISNPVQNAAGVVKELKDILAVVPSADDDTDLPRSPASAASVSRQGSSFDMARQGGLAGLAAGLGHVRDAIGGLGGSGRTRTSRLSDGTAAAIVAAGDEVSAAAAKPAATLEKSGSGSIDKA